MFIVSSQSSQECFILNHLQCGHTLTPSDMRNSLHIQKPQIHIRDGRTSHRLQKLLCQKYNFSAFRDNKPHSTTFYMKTNARRRMRPHKFDIETTINNDVYILYFFVRFHHSLYRARQMLTRYIINAYTPKNVVHERQKFPPNAAASTTLASTRITTNIAKQSKINLRIY